MDFPLNDTIIMQLNFYIRKIEKLTGADVIYFNSDIAEGVSGLINKLLIELKDDKKETTTNKLFFMLTTNGGSIEEVERIVNVTRHFYSEVSFAIPDYAYSAGTVLCMSGDDIYMNYYSVLGPIDPQVPNKDGIYIPAQGYLDKVDEFTKKSLKNELSGAEYMMLKELDLANLRYYQQGRELSIELLKKWLVLYKFKNWNKHSSNGNKVTKKNKIDRAKSIAGKLSDNNKWKSHGRGLDINTLRELKLIIEDFDKNADLSSNIFKYYDLAKDYMRYLKLTSFFHTRRFI